MTSFIQDVLINLKEKDTDFSKITFILPSKRAGVFLKHELSNIINKTIFSPDIKSIEEFVEELSELKSISNTELLFELYAIYSNLTKKELLENFDSFSKWAQILLQDFNEIDRYLIPQESIFNYLGAVKELEHWSVGENKTDLIKNYLAFWNNLYEYYKQFSNVLKEKKIGYQGLLYREAVESIETYIQNNESKKHVFLGFNALNTAEEIIIQELLQNNLAEIYWDIDNTFISNKNHDAGLFTREHKANWNYFNKHNFNWVTTNYTSAKNIEVIGVPKNVGQAKHIGNILDDLKKDNQTLSNTAVILGDENLLIPVLNSLPESIKELNITMGLPLKSIPLAALFEDLFSLHKNYQETHIYNLQVTTVLSHQFIRPLFTIDGLDYANKIIQHIQDNNLIYISVNRLKEIAPSLVKIIDLLFNNWNNNPNIGLQNCLVLISKIKAYLNINKEDNLLSLEYLFRFNEVFNQLQTLLNSNPYITTIKTLLSLFKELLSSESLDFQGENLLKGLQINGYARISRSRF